MEPQVRKEHYFRKKYDDLERFISYFHQSALIQELRGLMRTDNNLEADSRGNFKILEIGKGNGFFSDYMKKLGYNVTTCDFDKNLNPDVIADIRSLPFRDGEFDTVTAFEVLEHLPFENVPKALSELKRVTSRHAVISLPYKSTGLEFILKFPGVRTLCRMPFLNFFLRIPLHFGGIEVSGQHYWEIDLWKHRLSKVRKVIKNYFKIRKELSPALNKYHYFFILEK